MKRCESGGQYQAPQPRRHAGRMREAPSTEGSPLRLLWQTENKSQRIRRYQAKHRQHFKAEQRTKTGKGSRTRIIIELFIFL